jgi:hypothetical protein
MDIHVSKSQISKNQVLKVHIANIHIPNKDHVLENFNLIPMDETTKGFQELRRS